VVGRYALSSRACVLLDVGLIRAPAGEADSCGGLVDPEGVGERDFVARPEQSVGEVPAGPAVARRRHCP